MEIARLFDNITALAGVEAVWVFGSEGVAHTHLPPDQTARDRLDEVRSHVASMYAAMDAQLPAIDDHLLVFDARWLLLRRAGDYVLAVIASDATSPAAVRMVTKILARHLNAAAIGTLQPPLQPEPVAPHDDEPPTAERPVRMYRGQPY
tara:strand:- start:2503 stop:2949 length:447 start_codon:yes stop_codon:yes gene_type:complete